MRRTVSTRGQGMVEYAILFGLVIAALLVFRTYAMRGLQAKWKGVTDAKPTSTSLGEVEIGTFTTQYTPYYQREDTSSASGSYTAGNYDKGDYMSGTATSQTTTGVRGETGFQNLEGWSENWERE